MAGSKWGLCMANLGIMNGVLLFDGWIKDDGGFGCLFLLDGYVNGLRSWERFLLPCTTNSTDSESTEFPSLGISNPPIHWVWLPSEQSKEVLEEIYR